MKICPIENHCKLFSVVNVTCMGYIFAYDFFISHEIAPPLHQRRTLQMTRKENEGFGFVLQVREVEVTVSIFVNSCTS